MDDALENVARAGFTAAESWYLFAGHAARFRVFGERLWEEFDRPFAHLRLPPDLPRLPKLTVDIWDEATTGVRCPVESPTDDPLAPGIVKPSPDGRHVLYARAGSQFSFDRARRHIVGWVRDARRLTQLERGRPLYGPLHLWLQDRNIDGVHAGLVSWQGRGILFGGAGGSGKTTSSLTCLAAGFTYLSDDYVALETIEHGPAVGHSVFCSTHVAPAHLHRFGSLVRHAQPGSLPTEDKTLIVLSDAHLDGLGRTAKVSMLVLPRVVGHGSTVFRRARPAEALFRMAPNSVFLHLQRASTTGRRALDKLERLVRDTPAFSLDLGSDPREIPLRVHEMLALVEP